LGQGFTSVDPLKVVDICHGIIPRPTFVNKNLVPLFKSELIKILKEYVDCFAWNYNEMSSLNRDLVEPHLPIKPSFRPYKQPHRNFNPGIYDRVKEEVNCLFDAKFIWPCRYADWISNIVLVEKKGTKKLRVCIDFRDLNRVSPKDEYPMPVADFLVNAASGHRILCFLDGNASYNQIFMAEEDISKTAFICLGCVGLFEWDVVTSLILLVCKNVEFQQLDLNLSAYEIIKDVFLFPFPKVLDF
jgi:hypothetical protein